LPVYFIPHLLCSKIPSPVLLLFGFSRDSSSLTPFCCEPPNKEGYATRIYILTPFLPTSTLPFFNRTIPLPPSFVISFLSRTRFFPSPLPPRTPAPHSFFLVRDPFFFFFSPRPTPDPALYLTFCLLRKTVPPNVLSDLSFSYPRPIPDSLIRIDVDDPDSTQLFSVSRAKWLREGFLFLPLPVHNSRNKPLLQESPVHSLAFASHP